MITPVNIEVYEKLLKDSKYDKAKTEYLVSSFRNGFSLEYQGPKKVNIKSPNLKLRVGDEVTLWNKVMKEVKLKSYAGPFDEDHIPFKHFIQSPIGLVPKDNGKDTRLIFHLSYPRNGKNGPKQSVNANTPEELCKVKYPDFSEAIKKCLKLGKNCHLGRSDFQAAFRNLGMLKEHFCFLLMKAKSPLDGKWYYFIDKALPFGSSVSCKHFQEFSNSVAHIVQWKLRLLEKLINYLDDFLFAALRKQSCDGQLTIFLETCREINFPVNLDKTFWGTTCITFLGFLIETVRQIVGIPDAKISKGLNMVNYVLTKKSRKITVLQLQKLCGFLNFLGRVVVPGRAFTRHLYSYLSNDNLKLHHHIKVTNEIKLDLVMWKSFLLHASAYARSFMDFNDIISAEDLFFYSDASKNPNLGFGAICDKSYLFGRWDYAFVTKYDPSIQYLELFAVTAAVLAWVHRFKNRRIFIFTDNDSVKNMINNNSSSCKHCMILIRIIVLKQMIHNIRIYAKHVVTKKNGIADSLSRLDFRRFNRLTKGNVEARPTSIPIEIWPMQKVWDI